MSTPFFVEGIEAVDMGQQLANTCLQHNHVILRLSLLDEADDLIQDIVHLLMVVRLFEPVVALRAASGRIGLALA